MALLGVFDGLLLASNERGNLTFNVSFDWNQVFSCKHGLWQVKCIAMVTDTKEFKNVR